MAYPILIKIEDNYYQLDWSEWKDIVDGKQHPLADTVSSLHEFLARCEAAKQARQLTTEQKAIYDQARVYVDGMKKEGYCLIVDDDVIFNRKLGKGDEEGSFDIVQLNTGFAMTGFLRSNKPPLFNHDNYSDIFTDLDMFLKDLWGSPDALKDLSDSTLTKAEKTVMAALRHANISRPDY